MDDHCPACNTPVYDIDPKCPSCGEPLTSEESRRRIGTIMLESYEVTEVLGQGGMSVVYKGKHRITGQEVALKLLPPELAAYGQIKARFLEEARTLAQLDHPNIVHLYNFGDNDGCLVLAMQLVRGVTWERMILEAGKLPWPRSVEIAINVLAALEMAHSRGVIHRDMKPSNVLVRDDGPALVMDFGIAKVESSSRLTATGQTMGTVRYMSPEQVRGQQVDATTDLYSLTVSLYESVVGDTPFDGESHFEIMSAHLTDPPPPPNERGADIPAALESIIMAGLAKRPEDRPSSAKKLRVRLQEVMRRYGPDPTGEPGALAATAEQTASDARTLSTAPQRPAVTASAERPGRGNLFWIVLGGVALAAAALAVFMLQDGGKGEGPDRPGAAAPVTLDAATAADTVIFPQPGVPDRAAFATDKRYEEDGIHILAMSEHDPEPLRKQIQAARSGFTALTRQSGLDIGYRPLSLVLIPRARMCEEWIYRDEEGLPANCRERDYGYLSAEQTLVLVDEPEGLAGKLAYGVAVASCLHQSDRRCDPLAVQFGQDTAAK